MLEMPKTLRNKKASQLRKPKNLATESRALLKKSKKTKKRQREKLAEASHVQGRLRGLWFTGAKMKLPKRKKRQRKRVQVNPLIRESLKGRARAEEEGVIRTRTVMKSLLSSLLLSKSIVPGTGDARRRKKSTSRLRQ